MHPCGNFSAFTFTASNQVDPLRSFTFIREDHCYFYTVIFLCVMSCDLTRNQERKHEESIK